MEGICVAPRIRVPVSVPGLYTLSCRRILPSSRSWVRGIPMENARRAASLRVSGGDEESTDSHVRITYGSDYLANSVKVEQWESGKPVDDMAAHQGIRIRRRPPSGPPMHMVGPFQFRLENEGNTPRNILEKIIWDKDLEVRQLKDKKPLTSLKKALEDAPPVRDFIGALKATYQRTGVPALIAEVKKASPSRGVLREDFDPVEIANAYEKNGAACLSVLTDEKYFQGSFDNLEAIRRAGVKCPLLCKEFIVDAWQIYYARSKGADAILLIAAVLPDLDIKYLTEICRRLGLATLVEVHNEREMDRVLGIDGIHLIGINNRDLETFKVDISNTKKLLEGERAKIIREKGIIVVGESGLFAPDDIAYVQDAGVRACLNVEQAQVGEVAVPGEWMMKETRLWPVNVGLLTAIQLKRDTAGSGRADVDIRANGQSKLCMRKQLSAQVKASFRLVAIEPLRTLGH